MECCGFKSPSDWPAGPLPISCCPCTEVSCGCSSLLTPPPSPSPVTTSCRCPRAEAHPRSCLVAVRSQALVPGKFVGTVGIFVVTVVAFVVLSFLVSLCFCLAVR